MAPKHFMMLQKCPWNGRVVVQFVEVQMKYTGYTFHYHSVFLLIKKRRIQKKETDSTSLVFLCYVFKNCNFQELDEGFLFLTD